MNYNQRKTKLAAFATVAGGTVALASSALAALPTDLETALEGAATSQVGNINQIAGIGITVLLAFLLVAVIWKMGRKVLS